MKIDRNLVNNYYELDWDILLRTDLGNAGQLNSAKPYFDRIKKTLDFIIESPVIESLSDRFKQTVEAELNNFMIFLDSEIRHFSDVSLRNQKLEAVKNKEWQIVTNLSDVISYLMLNEEKVNLKDVEILLNNTKVELDSERLKLKNQSKDIEETYAKLSQSIELADSFNGKTEIIQTAIQRSEEWVKRNEEAVQLILKSNATDSAKKAEEHLTFKFKWVNVWLFKHIPYLKGVSQPSVSGSFFWILASLFSGLSVMLIISYFIYLDYLGREISLGSVLLRLSAVLIPVYFTFFSSQQYLSHRRLYEAYRFKDVTLQTMISLRKQNPDDSTGHVLRKAVEVIFSEPKMGGEEKYDKQIITQLLDVIKNKLG